MFVMVGEARFLGSGTETTSLYLKYIIRKKGSDSEFYKTTKHYHLLKLIPNWI